MAAVVRMLLSCDLHAVVCCGQVLMDPVTFKGIHAQLDVLGVLEANAVAAAGGRGAWSEGLAVARGWWGSKVGRKERTGSGGHVAHGHRVLKGGSGGLYMALPAGPMGQAGGSLSCRMDGRA